VEIKYTENSFLHIKLLKADPLNESLRQQRPLKVSNRRYPLQPEQTRNLQCCESGSGLWDQGSITFLISGFGIGDPGSRSGIGKKKSQDPDPGLGSGMENLDHFLRAEKSFFWLKYLNS
jgi:hypothetical protein